MNLRDGGKLRAALDPVVTVLGDAKRIGISERHCRRAKEGIKADKH